MNRMTDRCKTLPCRNFVAGGKNKHSPGLSFGELAKSPWVQIHVCNMLLHPLQLYSLCCDEKLLMNCKHNKPMITFLDDAV